MAHTGRGSGNAHSCAASRSVEVLPRPRGGSGAERPEIRAADGRHGSTECQVTQRHRSKGMERTCKTSPGSEASRGETQPFQGYRHARCAPGKAGSPAEITASADHRRSRKTLQRRSARLRPGRTVSDNLECGGTPVTRGRREEARTSPSGLVLAFLVGGVSFSPYEVGKAFAEGGREDRVLIRNQIHVHSSRMTRCLLFSRSVLPLPRRLHGHPARDPSIGSVGGTFSSSAGTMNSTEVIHAFGIFCTAPT